MVALPKIWLDAEGLVEGDLVVIAFDSWSLRLFPADPDAVETRDGPRSTSKGGR